MSDKPFVALACACERVLEEKDNVWTVVRVVDIFYIRSSEQSQNVPDEVEPGISFFLAISLRAVDLLGSHRLSLIMRRPDDTEDAVVDGKAVEITESPQNINIKARMVVGTKLPGFYFVDVLWNGEALTTIPFRLLERTSEPESDRSE